MGSRPWWKWTVTRSVEMLRKRSSGGKEAAGAVAAAARRRIRDVERIPPAGRPMNERG
jgi:hypothetical protein